MTAPRALRPSGCIVEGVKIKSIELGSYYNQNTPENYFLKCRYRRVRGAYATIKSQIMKVFLFYVAKPYDYGTYYR